MRLTARKKTTAKMADSDGGEATIVERRRDVATIE
eukprot:CAMPEP_0197419732 /NCGR_PEP_ID=MMETSP1170-20131217/5250_1 /TAXON_ID=54406 /ORGANISM="Sarcinochrysis sp, Strain CCMP770" /LENGTH=34 /DNA_ID= /DNA_START= /DNA_END= /DNA_ORIENTATION=